MKITRKVGVDREITYSYIPFRYVLACFITILEILSIIGVVVLLCYYVPYFYLLCFATVIGCVIKIIASDDNPDYKVPWLLFVLVLPIAGFMLYFMFSSRKLQKKYVRKLDKLKSMKYTKDHSEDFINLKKEDAVGCSQAKVICDIADASLFKNTSVKYFSDGELLWESMLSDLKKANKFIYLEYFIIERGVFWDSILEILKEKAKSGVDVRVVFDDIGCMSTLPGSYAKTLRKLGIKATPFSRLKGNADSEFNNRSHRKILVIDGIIGYTGGVNIADEYVNLKVRFGHWKDVGIRLEGEAVWELTHLFVIDYGINVKEFEMPDYEMYPTTEPIKAQGYVVPFGDGPSPLYDRRVGKTVIQNLLANAIEYAYFTSPYLIIDNDLCLSIENAALKGVDVRIVVPHIPDKKIIFGMTRSFYSRLLKAGVKIYEYTPGFIHAKTYLVDDKFALIGTMNLDYRSLVHHFENGVWIYDSECLMDIKQDIQQTIKKSQQIILGSQKPKLIQRFIRSIVRIFAPLL